LSFEETGLARPLIGAAFALGYDEPTPIQQAALPIVRRGGSLELRASSGAGATLAWGAGLLDRLATEEAGARPRALVLTATGERAGTVADALARLAAATPGEGDGEAIRGLRVRARQSGWIQDDADVLVLALPDAEEALATSQLKPGNVVALVVDDLSTMLALGGAEALQTLMVSVPHEAQRVLVAADFDGDAGRFAEAHARRAMRVPAGSAGEPRPSTDRTVGYQLAPEAFKLDALTAVLAKRTGPDTVLVRSRARATKLRDALARRGFSSGSVHVATFGERGRTGTIAYDVPFAGSTLETLDPNALVLVTPAERAHLRTIAADVGIALSGVPREAPRRGALAAYRQQVRRALDEEDLDVQLAILAPLFERHGAEEIAAALSALLRSRAAAAAPAAAPRSAGPPAAPAFVRLFVSAGQKDRLRPADLLGAITGESNVTGDQVGKIEIRDTFSVVEVAADAADRVIRALNGTTLRGRSLRVDYDRRASAGAVRRARPPRPGS
jgi:ATP-dependent RNA helicase DeaD